MDKVIKISEVKPGMMVEFAGKYRWVLASFRDENALIIRVNGKAQLLAPRYNIDVEVIIK